MSIINKIFLAVARPKRTLRIIKKKSWGLKKNNDYRKFIILSRSRTGSTLLATFLASHPNKKVDHEIFHNLNGKDFRIVLKYQFGKYPRRIDAVGFKIFYYHPLDEKCNSLWKALENTKDLYVIHLKRRNILRTHLSWKLANESNEWVKSKMSSTKLEKKKIFLSVDELNREFERTRNWEQEGDTMFAEHPMIEIYYEDIVNNPETQLKKVTDFLGLSYFQPETHLKKQNPEKLYELINNYDELKNYFEHTPWEAFFED